MKYILKKYIYSSIISSLFFMGYLFFVFVLSTSVGNNFYKSYFDNDGTVDSDLHH